uniref:Proteolipid protein 1b n=1 Tax=Scophthalmus maximus TaxID=52904 RepID=A0A8D3E799_SCOMX
MFPVRQPWLCKALGCYDCCVRCIGAVPYPSLVATLLLYAGMALFCGCGHEALTQTEVLDFEVMASFIKYFQYVIYGLASFFFLYGILLLAEGFYTTSAVKQTFGEFRSTHCGRCLSLTFIIVTYILAFIWLVVFAFTAIPVFFLFNMEQTCHDINILAETTPSINQHGWICMDARQYGLLPWNAMPGKACGMTLASIYYFPPPICKPNLFTVYSTTHHIIVLQFLYLAATTYNYAVLRFLGRKGVR